MIELFNRLRDFLNRGRLARELDEELRFHRAQLERDALGKGASATDAGSAARRRLGNLTAIAEEARAMWSFPWAEQVVHDAAYGVRSLARHPAFAFVVIATIALGVGANAAIFSVVNGTLLRPLPYPHADRIIAFGHEAPTWLTSEPNYIDYQRNVKSLDKLAAYTQALATVTTDGEPDRVRAVRVSPEFFATLGAPPQVGRWFSDDEFAGNPPTVVVISDSYWRHRFGGDTGVVRKSLILNGFKRTIVGVMPAHFNFPEARTDLWVPMPRINPDSGDRTNNYLFLVGRMAPGISVEHLRSDASLVASHIMRDNPNSFDPSNPLRPHIEVVSQQLVKTSRPFLLTLLGTVGFVLLIACANVANLLLARAEGRRREMAVRSAIGASGRRLVTQMLTESTIIALLGGAAGLAVAWAANRALVTLAPSAIPRLDEVSIDWSVIAFTMGASVLTGFLIGVVPALRAARGNVSDALKAGGRSPGTGVVRGTRRALVVAEVALAVVALAGAGMLLRSLWNLEGVDTGFVARSTLTARVSISQREYNNERAAAFYEQLLDRMKAIPGVAAAGAAGWLPVVDAGGLWGFIPEGRSYGPGSGSAANQPGAVPQQVTPGYFKAIGIPLLDGRDFTNADREGAPFVVVVSVSMAKTFWPGESALGKRFRVGGGNELPLMTIVGVVGDIRARGFTDKPEPTIYFPFAQTGRTAFFMPRAMSLVIRTTGEPMSIAGAVKAAVRALDPGAPVSEVRTLETVLGTSVATRKFSTSLLALFALLALVLAGIGTYGVIAYGVAQRKYEIGVRMALGAERSGVMLLVMSDGIRMCLIGLGIGLAISVGAARFIRAMLVGVSTFDAPTLASVCLALLVVAAVASLVPARRAMAVSPTEALRGD